MNAFEKYKKQKSGNGPATGADKEDANSDVKLSKDKGKTESDFYKAKKGKQTEKGIL